MAADTTTSRAPDARFLLAHPAHFIALGFGAGLAPWAPGTFGTLLALAMYWAFAWFVPPLFIAVAAVPLFFLGVWACGVTGRHLGAEDHGCMVWDEVVAFLPLAAAAHASIWMQLVAFGIFRGFDILKPPPIRYFEKNLRGGLGVMFDDVIAASYAFAVMIVLVIGGQKLLRELAA
ncbi:MAG TPA: phosphatidylglycerophosphatase A [Usitatibacter sp.]|nr:phosphatidylglycerophosphatase A [Usitatibacter sp.]